MTLETLHAELAGLRAEVRALLAERKEVLSREELATRLGVGVRTIDELVSARQIPFRRAGRRLLFLYTEVIHSMPVSRSFSPALPQPWTAGGVVHAEVARPGISAPLSTKHQRNEIKCTV